MTREAYFDEARVEITEQVRAMYESYPYPDEGSLVKPVRKYLDGVVGGLAGRRIRYLDAGCGTGVSVVGAKIEEPNWECYGVDLSQGSIDKARKLSQIHGVEVSLGIGDFSRGLPFEGVFDLISCFGVLHHCPDPTAALRQLAGYLAPGGWLLVFVYGCYADDRKRRVKKALDIICGHETDVASRFEGYQQILPFIQSHLCNNFPSLVLERVRSSFGRFCKRLKGRMDPQAWDCGYTTPNAAWVDHFCHPCERYFDVESIKQITNATGLEVEHFLNLERACRGPRWQAVVTHLCDLDKWSRWQVMELLAPRDRSPFFLARKMHEEANR